MPARSIVSPLAIVLSILTGIVSIATTVCELRRCSDGVIAARLSIDMTLCAADVVDATTL